MIVSVSLPFPPSVNSLTANKAGKGRVKSERYRIWRNAAGWELKAQRPGRVRGLYDLHLIFQRKAGRHDLGNLEKAVSDLLVEMQIVDDDAFAERIVLEWGDVEGCRVVVREAVSSVQREAAE